MPDGQDRDGRFGREHSFTRWLTIGWIGGIDPIAPEAEGRRAINYGSS
jgi:hypothetical protein